jgi:hypothetical protein
MWDVGQEKKSVRDKNVPSLTCQQRGLDKVNLGEILGPTNKMIFLASSEEGKMVSQYLQR